MYLDIDTNYLIKKDEIIGIFDLDNSTVNSYTKDFLNTKQKENKIIYIINDIPKSFILMQDGTVYIVELLAQILRKRLEIL